MASELEVMPMLQSMLGKYPGGTCTLVGVYMVYTDTCYTHDKCRLAMI